MGGDERDLVADEGVDEGSAASTTEGPASGAATSDDGVLGARGAGGPENPEQEAAPDDVGSDDTRAVPRTGQQNEVGEG